jgi:hypothetical protein
MKARAFLLLGILAILAAIDLKADTPPVGLEAVYRLDQLAVLKPALSVGSVSSYDRSGGNDDGFSGRYSFVRKEGDYLVLADLQGPGVIYRFWTPTPTEDLVEFLFDGESTPRVQVKFRDLFLGKHPAFPRPLVGFGAGGYYSYVPLPFVKSCVVRIKAAKVQFYQINYAQYSAGTITASFDPATAGKEARDRALKLLASCGSDLTAFNTPPGAKTKTEQSAVTIKPNTTTTVFQSKRGGRLLALRLSPASAMTGKARDLLLRISFDNQGPSVLCPLGDLFGYAWGQPAMKSLLLGTAKDTNYCYFPMPFKRGARVEIVSEREAPVSLGFEITQAPVPQTSAEGQFRALWRRENPTTDGQPFTFVDTQGRGHLVAVMLQVQGVTSGNTFFFEGDDQAWIDGELRIHGTGSEDFFNGGWYDVPDRWEKNISFPLSGCLAYQKQMGRTGAYRLFLGDAYSYRQSLRLTIEHSGEKNKIPTDNASVAMFYSEQLPAQTIVVPGLASRAVQDPAELVFPMNWQTPIHAWSFDNATLTRKKEKIGAEEVRYLSLVGKGADWFGSHFISPVCEVPAAGRYAIYLTAIKGPDQGIVQLFQNENPVAEAVDLYAAEPAKSSRLLMGRVNLEEGRNNLMFKLVGTNSASSGTGLSLFEIICCRAP